MLNTEKYKIFLNPNVGANDNFINISLKNGAFDFVDYTEDNTDLLTGSKESNVNPFDDGEKRMFKPVRGNYTFTFNFLDGNYWNRYTYAGFDFNEDILGISNSFTSSFYVIQVFDTFDTKKQILLSTGYYNLYNFAKIVGQSFYDISTIFTTSNSEALQTYIPVNYVNSISGNTFELYFKYYFYNAKLGKFIPFYNKGATSMSSPTNPSVVLNAESDVYLKVVFDKTTRMYTLPSTILYFNQFNNPEYNELINSTVDSIQLEKPTYPTGTSFTTNGKYEILTV